MVERSQPVPAVMGDGPTVLSYRRPADVADAYSDQEAAQDGLPPVVLRLPDLDEPAIAHETSDWVKEFEPIVSKVLMAAIAVLGLVLVILMWRGVGSNTAAASKHGNDASAMSKSGKDSDFRQQSTTPVGPFRLPMTEASSPANEGNHRPAAWPSGQNVSAEKPSYQPRNDRQGDVPPDMPRYAPATRLQTYKDLTSARQQPAMPAWGNASPINERLSA